MILFRSLPYVYLKLMALVDRIEHLSLKKGNVGNKAKVFACTFVVKNLVGGTEF